MIPKNLKVGDRFKDDVREFEVIGFDYEGRYISKVVGANAPTPIENIAEVKAEADGGRIRKYEYKRTPGFMQRKRSDSSRIKSRSNREIKRGRINE